MLPVTFGSVGEGLDTGPELDRGNNGGTFGVTNRLCPGVVARTAPGGSSVIIAVGTVNWLGQYASWLLAGFVQASVAVPAG